MKPRASLTVCAGTLAGRAAWWPLSITWRRSSRRTGVPTHDKVIGPCCDGNRDEFLRISSNSGPFEPPAGVLLALGSKHFRKRRAGRGRGQLVGSGTRAPALGEGWNNLAVVYMQSGRKSLAQDAVKHAERAGFRVNPRLKDDIARLPKPKPQGLIERSQQSY